MEHNMNMEYEHFYIIQNIIMKIYNQQMILLTMLCMMIIIMVKVNFI